MYNTSTAINHEVRSTGNLLPSLVNVPCVQHGEICIPGGQQFHTVLCIAGHDTVQVWLDVLPTENLHHSFTLFSLGIGDHTQPDNINWTRVQVR